MTATTPTPQTQQSSPVDRTDALVALVTLEVAVNTLRRSLGLAPHASDFRTAQEDQDSPAATAD